MLRTLSITLILVASTWQIGCVGAGGASPQVACAPIANPIFVSGTNHEVIWERTVDVLHDYRFEVVRENKLDGIIETDYKVGSSVFEPWHRETVGHENRWESTFQSIRRRALVTIVPAEGGYLVSTEVFQELEDLPGVAANSPGGATFQESTPLQRDLELVVGQSTPSGWLAQGRDSVLEQDMLHRLNAALSR